MSNAVEINVALLAEIEQLRQMLYDLIDLVDAAVPDRGIRGAFGSAAEAEVQRYNALVEKVSKSRAM